MQAAARLRRTGETPAKKAHGGQKPAPSKGHTPPAVLEDELGRIKAILEDYKAEQLVVIPLAGQASFADYLVVASGTSTRHVSSMGAALRDKLGKSAFLGLEGLNDGEWVCADLGAIVVHLFTPEKRALYNLEKLWSHVFVDADPVG